MSGGGPDATAQDDPGMVRLTVAVQALAEVAAAMRELDRPASSAGPISVARS